MLRRGILYGYLNGSLMDGSLLKKVKQLRKMIVELLLKIQKTRMGRKRKLQKCLLNRK